MKDTKDSRQMKTGTTTGARRIDAPTQAPRRRALRSQGSRRVEAVPGRREGVREHRCSRWLEVSYRSTD